MMMSLARLVARVRCCVHGDSGSPPARPGAAASRTVGLSGSDSPGPWLLVTLLVTVPGLAAARSGAAAADIQPELSSIRRRAMPLDALAV